MGLMQISAALGGGKPSGGGASPSVVDLSVPLSGAGRIGFYLDYSMRSSVGDHTFYVCRTHGTTGAVGVTWTAYDASGQLDTGTV